jgi:hypothetical protein
VFTLSHYCCCYYYYYYYYHHHHHYYYYYYLREAGKRIENSKTQGKRPLGRARRRWENNIRTDLREMVCEVIDWIYLAQ